ncbi:MAG TPA: DUF4105 domain-containing protein [Gemmatimonadales bacterium]
MPACWHFCHPQPSRFSPPALPPYRPPRTELSISVLTMGSGGEVWERFGHNAIVVEDHQQGTSVAYNYGMFSFRQENFLLRFIQGRMNYWMAGFDTDLDVARYRAAQRSVWRQELNLPPAQRVALRDFLVWNSRDENKFYRYDYYRDNCSTRVRDALDKAVGGAIKAQTSALPAGTTFRFHTQRLTTNDIPMYTAMQIATGRGADEPLSAWEEMFLPFKLREHLRTVRVPDDSGHMVPLVKSEETLYESNAFPVLDAPPRWIPNYLIVGLVLGVGLAVSGALSARSGWARVGFGALSLTWTWVTGIVGTLLAGMWAFTDHVIARRNENVLQFSVLALAVAILLIPVLRGKSWPVRSARALALGMALLSVAGLVGKILPGWIQANGQLVALAVPVNLGLAIGLQRFTRE